MTPASFLRAVGDQQKARRLFDQEVELAIKNYIRAEVSDNTPLDVRTDVFDMAYKHAWEKYQKAVAVIAEGCS